MCICRIFQIITSSQSLCVRHIVRTIWKKIMRKTSVSVQVLETLQPFMSFNVQNPGFPMSNRAAAKSPGLHSWAGPWAGCLAGLVYQWPGMLKDASRSSASKRHTAGLPTQRQSRPPEAPQTQHTQTPTCGLCRTATAKTGPCNPCTLGRRAGPGLSQGAEPAKSAHRAQRCWHWHALVLGRRY